jgi:hypothetical protein
VIFNLIVKIEEESEKQCMVTDRNRTKDFNKKVKYGISYTVHNIERELFDSFKYVGSVVNKDSAVDHEVKLRRATGNKVINANKRTMFSKLLSRSSEMLIYERLIRIVVTYGCV